MGEAVEKIVIGRVKAKILGITLLVALLASDASTLGGTTTRKIDGYQQAKWGMSPEQVRKACPEFKDARLRKVSYGSSQYPGELLTEELVSTFSFFETILGKHTSFDFYFYRNQLYRVQLSSSRPLDYKYFEWFWEAIERKYKPTEGHREFPTTLSKLGFGKTWTGTESIFFGKTHKSSMLAMLMFL